ncbi:peptidoglycan-binding domain-containing protein [Streptomyces sp. MUM 178J]|uniref:peptidoglycan-binding domain-containing protein n=1 Tax=Streptomyces sp. MUM 178J TaxID=2791991 RepID=UPI001F04CCD5|nr:peptidoglycan-binding domain-containing protein [Streptomyces sp. MUM 178J]WRQ79229.1 peptidoglycan-binding domain-containing protein [Streptomyces sp. MUM 178J]
MTSSSCPECGAAAPAGAAGATRPGCDCAVRAAEAMRARRQAEIDAAEDFNPLRVRPYVTLQGPQAQEGEQFGSGDGSDAATVQMPAVTASTAPPAPVPESPAQGSPEQAQGRHDGPYRRTSRRAGGGRRRPPTGLLIGAAALCVAATAAFAGGLFSADAPEDRALPDPESPAASVSDAPAPSASATPSTSPSASLSASASASPSASPTPSAASSPSSASGGSTLPSAQAAEPSAAPSTTQATGTVTTPQAANPGGGTLRRGDSGAGVQELQLRLAQLGLFQGSPDGEYDRDVENAVLFYQGDRDVAGDPDGVYGPQTRRALEAETTEA